SRRLTLPRVDVDDDIGHRMTTTERHGSRVHLLARGGALSLVGSVVTGILAFALVVVVTRTLHPGGAGAFFEAVALFTIISNTAELGADTGLVREVSQSVALGRVQELRSG